MLIKVSIIFLIFSIMYNSCTCNKVRIIIDSLFDKKDTSKFPWSVVMYSTSDKSAYDGSLIHRKAVLVSTMHTHWFHNHNFEAFAGCNLENEDMHSMYENCQVRNVNHFYTLTKNRDQEDKNVAVVMLTKPFEMTEKVNLIGLQKFSGEINFDRCAIVYFLGYCNEFNECELTSQKFSLVDVRIHEKKLVNFDFNISKEVSLKLKKLYKKPVLEVIFDNLAESIFAGSPIICRSNRDNSRWIQIGIFDAYVKSSLDREKFTVSGDLQRIDSRYSAIIYGVTILP